ncbi:MAG: class I SAM-dependent methyltransferase [Eubacteriales bacterium]|nr:class I SAM-dependent methyltransferase [Eubacteriales bacterium]
MIELTPRLKTIADLACLNGVPTTVCDVGTDHGYIPVYLAQLGAEHVIATDISAPSAQKAIDNATKYSVSEILSVRVGDGLNTVKHNEAECVIIAGMGGLMITKILSAYIPKGVKNLVLQPMRSGYELRQYLVDNGFSITKEVLCEDDNRIYNIMLVDYGTGDNNDFNLNYGKIDRSPLYYKYIEKRKISLSKKIDGIITGGGIPDSILVKRLTQLDEILEGR